LSFKEKTLEDFFQLLLPEIDNQIKEEIERISENYSQLKYMLRYHMGWEENEGARPQGKRIRPLLLLLSVIGSGEEWKCGLSAAAAVELVHNFSLIHDDIEDKSEYRRGRKTLWVKWGIPQAINAGDLMFSLAQNAIANDKKSLENSKTIELLKLLQKTCIKLTQGQHLDLLFESEELITVDQYLNMISGKTAALLSCSTEMGAIIAGANEEKRRHLKEFGFSLGMAFQVVDDILGVWGEEDVIGKSVDGDIAQKKKTLPILYALQSSRDMQKLWRQNVLDQNAINELRNQMEKIGAKKHTEKIAKSFSDTAMKSINLAITDNSMRDALLSLTNQLLSRVN